MRLNGTEPGLWLAVGSFAGAAIFLLLVAGLHVLKPQLHPSSHMISEYAVGARGWMMQLAFYALAISCATLAAAVRVRGTGAGAGVVLLVVAAVGAAGAGFFITDPAGTSRDVTTPAGVLHVVFSFIFIPVFPLAATLTSRGMGSVWLRWSSGIAWLGLLGFLAGPAVLARIPSGPRGWAGYLQRFMVLAYVVWLLSAAWLAMLA